MSIRWTKQFIAAEAFETAAIVDVDGDGIPDIVSGSFWYKGPDFSRRFVTGDIPRVDEYYDDFSAIPVDLDGDGRVWLVTGGFWGGTLRARQVTADGPWRERVIANTGNIEKTCAWDVDGDGELEIVPNTPNGPLVIYKKAASTGNKQDGEFVAHQIWSGLQGHGLGFGDISGSGRGDFVMNHGWLEAPEDRWEGEWLYHDDFDLGKDASVPIIIADVDGDGVAELIVGRGHGYGLDWWEQKVGISGEREWSRHPIDPFSSQYHDLAWADIDGDGEPELVTGKRWRAHPNDIDAGADDPLGLYYFKWTGEGFAKNVISYGPLGVGVGCGISFAVGDLTNSGRLDIVAPGKDGLYVFFNEDIALNETRGLGQR